MVKVFPKQPLPERCREVPWVMKLGPGQNKNRHHPYLADVQNMGYVSAGVLTYTILDLRF
jgi:hypothetical protein